MNPQVESAEHCVFAHPWIDDAADLDQVELVFGASAMPFVKSLGMQALKVLAVPAGAVVGAGVVAWVMWTR